MVEEAVGLRAPAGRPLLLPSAEVAVGAALPMIALRQMEGSLRSLFLEWPNDLYRVRADLEDGAARDLTAE